MDIPEDQSVIEYPCRFPIKVMGLQEASLVAQMIALTQQHAPTFNPEHDLELRPSSGGKYLGLTITVTATSRLQLDTLYRAFTSHPLVKYVL
jgi:uncharacterized protein